MPFNFQKNDFFNIGVYIVLSIVYGGKGYPFLAEPVFDYLSTERYNITIPEEDIPDSSLKHIVTKVYVCRQLGVSFDGNIVYTSYSYDVLKAMMT